MRRRRLLGGALLCLLPVLACSDDPADPNAGTSAPETGEEANGHDSTVGDPVDLCGLTGDRFPIFEPVPEMVKSLDYQFVENRVSLRIGLGGEPSPTSRERWTGILVASDPLESPGAPTTVRTSGGEHDGVFFERDDVGVAGDEVHTNLSIYWTEGDLYLSAVSLDVPQSDVEELLSAMTIVDKAAFVEFQTEESLDTVLCQ